MPYATNDELPLGIRRHPPVHAQGIYRSAFDHAWDKYSIEGSARCEELAHRIAWAAVKRRSSPPAASSRNQTSRTQGAY